MNIYPPALSPEREEEGTSVDRLIYTLQFLPVVHRSIEKDLDEWG